MQLSYELRADGRWELEVSTSGIPSAVVHMDGAENHRHDMLELQADAIDGFITAGNCTDAPREVSRRWAS